MEYCSDILNLMMNSFIQNKVEIESPEPKFENYFYCPVSNNDGRKKIISRSEDDQETLSSESSQDLQMVIDKRKRSRDSSLDKLSAEKKIKSI